MSTWTATRSNPRVVGSTFLVDYQILQDGVVVFQDTATTTQPQDSTWPQSIIRQKIAQLRDVPAMAGTITPGDITPPADPVVDQAKLAWQLDYARYTTLKPLVDMGVIPASNAKWTALVARITNNFRVGYIDLP